MTRSLRGRLLIALIGAGGLIIVAVCVAMVLSVHRTLNRNFNEMLLARSQALTAIAEQDINGVHFSFDAQPIPEFLDHSSKKRNKAFFEIRLDTGEPVGHSPSLRNDHLLVPQNASADPRFADVTLPGGRAGRSVTYRFTPMVDEDTPPAEIPAHLRAAVITVAHETDDLDETLVGIITQSAIVGVIALLASAVLTAWIIRRSLRPLMQLADGIDHLRETQSGQRIALASAPVELAPVVDTLNALLARMDAAMARERGFTADVAHELRTPLSALRTTIEVAQTRARSPEEYAAILSKCGDLGDHVQSLIDTLLLLARADAGQLAVHPRPIDLVERVDEWFILFQPRAQARRITLNWQIPDAAAVTTDPALLQIIVNNLFDNAVSYCNEGGTLTIRITREERARLTVSNTGCTLADASHVFDRFWRADPSRTDVRRHHGLGLSLSKQAADLLGHTLTAKAAAGEFRITLIL